MVRLYHVIRMQATFRCNQKIKAYKRYVEATIMLQKHDRCSWPPSCRRQHQQQIKMLSLVRMFIERQKLRRWRRAVNMIASVYRICMPQKFFAKFGLAMYQRCLTSMLVMLICKRGFKTFSLSQRLETTVLLKIYLNSMMMWRNIR